VSTARSSQPLVPNSLVGRIALIAVLPKPGLGSEQGLPMRVGLTGRHPELDDVIPKLQKVPAG